MVGVLFVLVFTFVSHLFLHWWGLVSFLTFVVEGWRGQVGELFSIVSKCTVFVANVSCLDLSPSFLSIVFVFGVFGCHLFLSDFLFGVFVSDVIFEYLLLRLAWQRKVGFPFLAMEQLGFLEWVREE